MTFAMIISIAGNIFALIAAVFGIMSLSRIAHVIKLDYKKPFFRLLVTGVILYVIAETIKNVFEFALNIRAFPSIADIFHIGGALALVSGFIYFWIVTKAWSHFNTKDWALFIAGMGLSTGYMIYLFFGIIIPEGMYHYALLNFLNFFYPIATTLTFILSYVLHTHYRKGLIRKMYLYLADGVFFIFMGDMFFSYVSWTGTYGISGSLSDLFYLLGYMLFAVSFYIFYKKGK